MHWKVGGCKGPGVIYTADLLKAMLLAA